MASPNPTASRRVRGGGQLRRLRPGAFDDRRFGFEIHHHVDDVTYGDDDVVVNFEAKPAIVERARAKAADLATPTDSA